MEKKEGKSGKREDKEEEKGEEGERVEKWENKGRKNARSEGSERTMSCAWNAREDNTGCDSHFMDDMCATIFSWLDTDGLSR